MALSGWSNRLKLIIDSSKIDEDVENFPVLIVLSSSTGQGSFDATDVFDELTISGSSYTSRKKIAITTSDEETQCYVEIERWDHTNEKAYLWTKIPTIVSGTNTNIYFYYDKDKSDNDSYVGDVGSGSGQTVWDSNFKAVYHFGELPTGGTGCIKDSTSNLNHGTPAGSMTSGDLVDGKAGKALNFDGLNDCINCGSSSNLDNIVTLTVETVFKAGGWGDGLYGRMITKSTSSNTNGWQWYVMSPRDAVGYRQGWTTEGAWSTPASSVVLDTWYHSVVQYDRTFSTSGNPTMYLNGVSQTVSTNITPTGSIQSDATSTLSIAARALTDKEFEGIIDEIRISDTTRSSSWIKATYHSNWDDLITYSQSTYYFSGYIYEEGIPVSRTLYLHNRIDGSLIATTTSSGDGYYYLETIFSDPHYIVCLDDEAGADYNDMILGNMFPLVVT